MSAEKPSSEQGSGHRSVVNNPMHGITLKTVVTELHARYGWEGLGQRVPLKCFTNNPSMGSSLKFLRQTPWAREKVEALDLASTQPDISSEQSSLVQPNSERPGESRGADVWNVWRSKPEQES